VSLVPGHPEHAGEEKKQQRLDNTTRLRMVAYSRSRSRCQPTRKPS